MKRNIVESYSVEEAFKALNKKQVREAVNADIQKELSTIVGIYAEKLSFDTAGNKIRISTTLRSDADGQKLHNELKASLEKAGYKVDGDFYTYNTLIKEPMSFIDVIPPTAG